MDTIIEWIKGWTGGGSYSICVFIPFAILVFFAAIKLVKYAEVIVVKTKFGGAFVGGALIAAITSLPEFVTEIAQGASGHPAGGISDDLGSNAFGAFLIGLSALIFFRSTFMSKLGRWSKISLFISAGIAFVLMFTTMFHVDYGMGTKGQFIIGIIPMLTFVFYLVVLFLQYKFGDEDGGHASDEVADVTAKQATVRLIIWSLILIAFSLCLNWSAVAFSEGVGLGDGVTAGIFLAVITSLPEITAFFALLKKKRPVVAVAALVGSHIFNVGITFFGDMAYKEDAYYNGAEKWKEMGLAHKGADIHAVWPLAAMTALMMVLLGIQALLSKRFTSLKTKLIIPSLVVAIYIGGWIAYILCNQMGII